MTEGIPEWPTDTAGGYAIPVPLVEHTREETARPSERQMESSRIRRRRMQVELQEFLKASWNFTEDEFDIFVEWYEEMLENGSTQFLLKTYEDDPVGTGETIEVWWELAFVGDPQHTRSDNLFSVSATLEVLDKSIQTTLPEIVFGYFHDEDSEDDNGTVEDNPSDCRENVSVVLDGLTEGAVYQLVISESADGPWSPYIYFSLLTPEERSTKHKRVTMSNWFGGDPVFFRVKLFKDEFGSVVDTFLSKPGSPEAAELAPPEISLANATEITTSDQLSAVPGTKALGLRPLDFYNTGNSPTPFSYLESPLSGTSHVYRMFTKKYAIRQWAWGSWGDLLAAGNQNQPVTASGPAGATIKWTRDGTVPTLATPDPLAYGGVANNAYCIDDKFPGIIVARCFKDGCRSPLTMVAVDKIMYERPTFKSFGVSNDAGSYCDLPVIDVVTGLPLESGNSCVLLYGSICDFEEFNYSFAASAANPSNSANDPSGHGPLLRSRSKHLRDSTYIGWPIHGAHSAYYEFGSSTWNLAPSSGYFNGWQSAPRTLHSWAILCRDGDTLLGILLPDPSPTVGLAMSICGPVGGPADADRALWDANRDAQILDILDEMIIPVPDCLVDLDHTVYADRYDIVRSPLYWYDMRDTFWLDPDLDLDSEPDVPDDPIPVPPPTNPYDDFETYVDGDATAQTMSFRTGTDWNAAWTIRNGTAQTTGYDTWESYAVGTVPDHVATPAPDYIPYDDGEAWDPGVEWVFRVGELTSFYKDDFESYSNGPTPFEMTGGTGWNTADVTGWVIGGDLIGGSELWETYSNGAIVVSNTGSNFLLSENWRIT